MNRKEEVKRKVRSDKKRDVKPTIPIELYDCISRLSYITSTPMKDVSEQIICNALTNQGLIELLSKHFRRDYWFSDSILFKGIKEQTAYRTIKRGGIKRRLTIRFQQPVHDKLCELAYALDLTVSSTTGLLLDCAVRNSHIVYGYIDFYIEQVLDEGRLKQLKEVMRFIESHNPYEEKVTIAMLIDQVVSEFKDTTRTFKEVVSDWIDKTKE